MIWIFLPSEIDILLITNLRNKNKGGGYYQQQPNASGGAGQTCLAW